MRKLLSRLDLDLVNLYSGFLFRLGLHYGVLCSRVWPHLGQFTNLHNLHCYIQLRPQVRNGLSFKYRVLCSSVWPHLGQFTNLHNLHCYIQLRPQVRNGLTFKYRVLCCRVWPHLGKFTNLHIQLRPQVRNGLSFKYRVLCSRVWPHLGQFTNYITLVIMLLSHDWNFFLHVARPTALLAMGWYPSLKLSITCSPIT